MDDVHKSLWFTMSQRLWCWCAENNEHWDGASNSAAYLAASHAPILIIFLRVSDDD